MPRRYRRCRHGERPCHLHLHVRPTALAAVRVGTTCGCRVGELAWARSRSRSCLLGAVVVTSPRPCGIAS
eukprot:scaffold124355_cov28-Tisochrysis_lutea.AAC.2